MLRWLWLSAVVLVLDQATKFAADDLLTLYAPVEVLPFFNLSLSYNPGAAFSFLAGASGWQRWFFSVLALGVSVFIVLWIKRLQAHERWTAAGLALILAGAIGNLIDRLLYGHVVDFIQLYYDRFYWPTFNIADSAITVGAVVLVVHTLFFGSETAGKAAS
ncbi:MAG: signal peptidase II [Chromatiales bacterium]|jgi:signal peptidase II|nr:signal peptidase II [Chromatiales bacterium]MDX9767458.1 signal peptidase II [Ectothiorhodospiraceae bacterium]